MRFYDSILNYLQKRSAEKEAKGKGIRGILVMLCAAVGSFLGTVFGVSLPILGLSFSAALPLTFSLISIFALAGIVTGRLIVWPRVQRMLAESDDNFNYHLFIENEFESRLEKIRTSKVSKRTKERWEEDTYDWYSEELKRHQTQIDVSRRRFRDHRRMMSDAALLQEELANALTRAAARQIEEQVNVHLKAKGALNPASTDAFSDTVPRREKEAQER